MQYYDELIAYARVKQRGRRHNSVHLSVPNPILVLVIGDAMQPQLDALYDQLVSHWSSRLNALQVCYFYQQSPYGGSRPIRQVQLAPLPQQQGPGALLQVPDGLQKVNGLISDALDRVANVPGLPMLEARVPVILSSADAAQCLASDITAVTCARLEEMGIFSCICNLFMLLPVRYGNEAERLATRGLLEQIEKAYQGPYEQPVLLLPGGSPRNCRIRNLFDAVVVLDEVDEFNRRYNMHGERLQLLCDLIEYPWRAANYIQTAGAQEKNAGPEYWLAQAMDEVCSLVQKKQSDDDGSVAEALKASEDSLTRMVAERLDHGVERALQTCCLFLPGRFDRLTGGTVDEAERAVFGSALQSCFTHWLSALPPLKLPEEVQDRIQAFTSDEKLEKLAYALREWAKECERGVAPPPAADCRKLALKAEMTAAQKAAQVRRFLAQVKYAQELKNEEYRCLAQAARLAAGACMQRLADLKREREEFEEFSRAIQQVWLILRDSQGDAVQPVTWLMEKPPIPALRTAGAAAARGGDLTQVLDMIADRIDLDGPDDVQAEAVKPALYCHLVAVLDPESENFEIPAGSVSTGRVLRLTAISQDYDKNKISCVHILQQALKD